MPSITWGKKTEPDEYSHSRFPDFSYCPVGHQRRTFFTVRVSTVQ